jgi:hypothetical protein
MEQKTAGERLLEVASGLVEGLVKGLGVGK